MTPFHSLMPASGVLLCAQILDEHVSCHLFGTFELIHESLTWKVYSAFVFFFFFPFGEFKPVHVHSYKVVPTTCIHITFKQTPGQEQVQLVGTKAPSIWGQLYNREAACRLNHDRVTSWAGTGPTF